MEKKSLAGNPSLEKFELLRQESVSGTLKEPLGRKILAIDDKYRDKRFRVVFGILGVLLLVGAPFLGVPTRRD